MYKYIKKYVCLKEDFFCFLLSHERLWCCYFQFKSLMMPFFQVGLKILRMKHYHSVPYLIQKYLCVSVNSWSVLNIKVTWFDYSTVNYSVYKVSTSLKRCQQFHTFNILIIYYFNIATATFPTKIIEFLLKQFDKEYCTRLQPYPPPSNSQCLISLAVFKSFLRG